MPISAPSFKPQVRVGANNATVRNILVTTAATEESIILNSGVRAFILRPRGLAELTVSFSSGGDYITVPRGASLKLEDIEGATLTLYVTSSENNTTLELLEQYT